MYAVVNEDSELDLYAQESDICFLCSNICLCPLLAALKNEVVILRYEAIGIEECALFDEISLGDLLDI